ncbi:MAG: RNA-binding protein [Actinobacteria bacterium]|nr:RNA-binding protein [Actinomycetota bacterium]MBW3642975.1 RNA-binding protein [Actinomycetota bacterium]
MTRWLVDGSNVVGARPDGWWRDRPAAFARLAGELARYARDSGDDVTVVFDGPPLDVDGHDVTVVTAPCADDRMVELASNDLYPSSFTAVTSDRDLAARLRRLGTDVTGSGSFRRLLDAGR